MSGSRELDLKTVSAAVEELAFQASLELPADIEESLLRAAESESKPLARYALRMLAENAHVARSEGLPLCQDTGMFHLFIELGEGTSLPSGYIAAADRGLREATAKIPLRSSLVDDPLFGRANRGDNTPVVVHVDEGGPAGKVRLTLLAKGGGSENATHLFMLLPGEGWEGVKRVVLEAVIAKGAQACPPIVVGVGVGSDASGAIELALKSLLRPLGSRHQRESLAACEDEMLESINALGIGAAGLGGDITALDVHVEEAPAHIASLPVGVVLCCHALRRRTLEV
ncbi:MAG: fumarate hydratase [Actinobacteria bacterium]|jgi:fumarate hydratase subunit alpha|nr:MAG: fumarate hydratase [Actinomycetota bacterium]